MQVDDDASTVSSKPTSAPFCKVLKFSYFIIESPKPKDFQAKVGSLLLHLMVSLSKCLSS